MEKGKVLIIGSGYVGKTIFTETNKIIDDVILIEDKKTINEIITKQTSIPFKLFSPPVLGVNPTGQENRRQRRKNKRKRK